MSILFLAEMLLATPVPGACSKALRRIRFASQRRILLQTPIHQNFQELKLYFDAGVSS